MHRQPLFFVLSSGSFVVAGWVGLGLRQQFDKADTGVAKAGAVVLCFQPGELGFALIFGVACRVE